MFEQLRSQWELITGALGLLAIFGVYFLWQNIGRRRRRRFFADRIKHSQEAWFRCHYPVTDAERALLVPILEALAFEIGVEWTQLRPDDTFARDLFVDSRYASFEDLEEVNLVTWDLVRQKALAPDRLPSLKGTLGDFLDGVLRARVSLQVDGGQARI